jgi:hypothetical protein
VGHHDGKWFPLGVSKDGLRIEPKHQFPHRYKSIDRFVLKPEQNDDGLLVDPDRASTIAMTTDNLAVIKAVVSILQEFVTTKEGMSAAAAASTVTSQ